MDTFIKRINDNVPHKSYSELVNKYFINDITNIITEYAMYEKLEMIDNTYGYLKFGKKEFKWVICNHCWLEYLEYKRWQI